LTARLRARAVAVVIGVLGALAAVEATLQAIAWIRWQRNPPAAGHAGARRVLCLGDSFTFGFGAEDPRDGAYPRVLERLLQPDWPDLAVVNRGWPGNTSADVLRTLAAESATRPAVVCVLVGVNDLSLRPARLTADEEAAAAGASAAFPWRFRLGLLASLAWDLLRGGPAYSTAAAPADAAPPFVGVWHVGSIELRLAPDGEASLGPYRYRWRQDGADLVLESEAPPRMVRAAWRAAGGKLLVTVPDAPELPFEPGPARDPVLIRGDELAAAEGPAAAERHFRALLDHPEHGGAARLGLVASLCSRGQREEAEGVFAGFGDALASPAAPARAFAIRAALALGDFDRGIELGLESLDLLVPDPVWDALNDAAVGADGRAAVAEALARAADSGRWSGAIEAQLHRLRAVLLGDVDRAESLLSMVRSALLVDDAERERLAHWSFRCVTDLAPAEVDAAIARLGLGAEDAARVRATFARALTGAEEALAILDDHLRRIVAACRARGSVPVLLTYPFPFPRHRALVETVARSTATALVDLAGPFARLEQRERVALFATDGHCNTAGYARMAELVAADLQPLLRQGDPGSPR
jgi:lysophospholipase L1-like esterase